MINVGIMFANGGRSAEPEHAIRLATLAEATGYESIWAVQHVVMPVEHSSTYPYAEGGAVPGGTAVAIPDPLVWLAWAGAHTTHIRLGTGVLVLPQQHPLVVAKQVATLDRLTGGRVILGIGAGWLQEEFSALDAEFAHRGARTDEGIQVLRRAWSMGPASFDGQHISFPPVHVEPKPGRMPQIVVGGHTAAAARRAGRLADGFFPLSCQGPELLKLVDVVRTAATEAGRDPDTIEITADAPRTDEQTAAQLRCGVTRVVVNAPHVETHRLEEALEMRLAAVRERFSAA